MFVVRFVVIFSAVDMSPGTVESYIEKNEKNEKKRENDKNKKVRFCMTAAADNKRNN